VKKVGLEPGVKERGGYGWREWGVDRVRRCGRRMNREVRDRGTGAVKKLTMQGLQGVYDAWRKITVKYRQRRLLASRNDVRGKT